MIFSIWEISLGIVELLVFLRQNGLKPLWDLNEEESNIVPAIFRYRQKLWS